MILNHLTNISHILFAGLPGQKKSQQNDCFCHVCQDSYSCTTWSVSSWQRSTSNFLILILGPRLTSSHMVLVYISVSRHRHPKRDLVSRVELSWKPLSMEEGHVTWRHPSRQRSYLEQLQENTARNSEFGNQKMPLSWLQFVDSKWLPVLNTNLFSFHWLDQGLLFTDADMVECRKGVHPEPSEVRQYPMRSHWMIHWISLDVPGDFLSVDIFWLSFFCWTSPDTPKINVLGMLRTFVFQSTNLTGSCSPCEVDI